MLWDVLLNRLFASRLWPEGQRWRLYRLAGFDFERCSVAANAWLSPFRPPIHVGAGSYINHGLVVLDASAVTIGERCTLGPQVMLAGSSHEPGPPGQRAGRRSLGAITVGDGCWLGARVIVLPDTVIGPGVVVAAGSVAKGTLEPNGLYAGIPATRRRDLPTGR
jgi:maltose O-acetyltransferase